MSWNATVQRAEFTEDGSAVFLAPQPNAAHTIVVSSSAPNLAGARALVEGSVDGDNYAPVPSGDCYAAAVVPLVNAALHSIRVTVSGYGGTAIIVSVCSGMSGQHIRQFSGHVAVQEVTPS